MTDLLVIKPGAQKDLYQGLSKSLSGLEPPLWGALLAGYIRDKGYSVKMVDAEIEPERVIPEAKKDPRLIAIVASGTNPSASTMSMVGVRTILKEFKKESLYSEVILMGLHPSALPERTLKEEDVSFVCQGEGFSTIWGLLSNEPCDKISGLWWKPDERLIGVEHKRIFSNPPAKLADPNLLPMPAWNLLPMDKYRAHNWHCFGGKPRQPYGVVYTSLGCPFKCSFCCINAMFGKHTIRYRNPKDVVEEISYLHDAFGIRNLKIIDEMFDLNEKHVVDICDGLELKDLDLNIWAYARVDTINKNKLKKMKKAGFNWLGLGYESGNQQIRNGSSKGKFDNQKIFKVTQMIKDAGMSIGGNFIFGLPGDDFNSMYQTAQLMKKLNCEWANLNVCMPYPGSDLFKKTSVEDMPESWLGYSQYGYLTKPLSTKYLTPAEILAFRDRAFNDYYERKEYQDMMLHKFGVETVHQIQEMLQHKLHRKILEEE